MNVSRRRGRWRLFGVAGLLLSGLAGAFVYNWLAQRAPPSEAVSSSERFAKIGVFESKEKPEASDFSLLELMSGKPISIKDLRGKVIFLNFWAT